LESHLEGREFGVNVMRALLQMHLTLHSTTDKILHRLTLRKCCRLMLSLEFWRKNYTSPTIEVQIEHFVISMVGRRGSVGTVTCYWLDGWEFETR